MLNTDTPAGSASGQSPTPTGAEQGSIELPAKLRVHALAKLLGSSSREIINTLESIGESVRSAQSNITREVALQVVQALNPELVEPETPAEQPEAPAAAPEEKAEPEQPAAEEPAAEQAAPEPEQAPAVPAAHFASADREATPEGGASAGLTPTFAAPEAMFLAPSPQEPRPEQKTAPAPAAAEEPAESKTEAPAATEAETESEEDSEGGGRRRRRRGRRGRGRGRGADGETSGDGESEASEETTTAEAAEQPAEAETTEEQPAAESEGSGESNRRRRRRRRRKGGSDDESGAREDDPPNTVVHVREPAAAETRQDSSDDEVRAVKGSTRLEAKRQRRRDGREAGRRRAPVLSEAEFLARRESVDRKMAVRQNGDQTQIAVLEDNVLVENFVTSSGTGSLVGNVYLGRVQNVLPSMEAAFVDIGRGRNAVLYAGEVDWDAAGLAGKARRIEQALSTGDSVLVQVTKDPVGHKGARLTTQISLPGRFLVYVPGGGATGISRKLPDTERKRLKEILKRIVPDNAGVIIRTASEGTSEEALDRDVRRLQAQWEVIKEKAETPGAQAPQLLYEEPDLLIKVVRDLFTEDFSQMTVQGNDAWDTIEAYVQHVAPDLAQRLVKHVGKNDVFTEQRINEQIAKALDRKVWLPSGGYLVIDRTEAMTVIDVNTGKFTGSGGNLEETVTRNNLEAAEEIVRQLRLRDIGGIIVIDFIDMVLESNRDLVLRRLTECLGRDRTRHQVAEVTSLGLVQMTRKRVGTGLLEAYSSTCEHCRGRGLLVSTEPTQHHNGHGGGGGGNNNNGSRRNRNRGKQQDEQPERTEAKAPEPVKESPKAEEPKAEPAKPVEVKAPEAKPAEKREAEPKPAEAPKERPVEKPEAAKPAEAAKPVESAKPVEEAKPAEKAAEPTAAEPKAEAAPAAKAGANGRRRKATRATASAGAPVAPLVITKPAEPAKPADNGMPEVAPAAPVRRVRRRSSSRPAGPPVEG
ncbi:translation initiation factor IF-2 N-terminal domain-containing protein [Saccharopolyspora sp. WRP15-2]|uniref:Translation initiation factor IF-2 N-terminal domain-containing protein n=1 Tax=Saccharopolyspora oryzae TaxID=2997343 RepID=A0ABT4V096_9PSEU|nr:translation initiation factor IF-2 N-terminal domain-containing protein [Saccharopolyspora oryzae]MDA3626732.1 translation initiation factor IF-2 N-terminal domain-containing protein [Saccharopolyspora oryzae]